MSDRLGWGVVGAGQRAGEVMIPALMSSSGCRVVGVHSRDLEGAKAAAAEWPEVKTYAQMSELLADPEVQVVYIASPHFLHVPQAVQAIESKKHVFMESPMALSVDGAHKLVEKARSAGVRFGVAFQYRFHSALSALREKIAEGGLGKIKHISVRCAEPLTWNRGWWCDANRSGPAALLRLGVHALDLVSWLRPEKVTEIMAMGVDEGDSPISTMVSMILRFDDGSLGWSLGASAFSEPDHGVRVEGEEGRLFLEGDFSGQGHVTLLESRDGKLTKQEFEPDDPVGAMVDAFSRSVGNGDDFHPDGLDGKNIVQITCAAIESMKSRRAVKVGEVVRAG